MNTLTLDAPAKINLTLDIGPRRADGYHDIRSVMQTVALHDTLTLTRTPDAPGVHLEVVGSEALGVPSDAANLVHQAAHQMMSDDRSGLNILLTKRIPSQAGLGGGSSDAAATLRAVNRLFDLNLSLARLTELAVALGADVPFFLTGGTALVEGLGERVTPLPPATSFPLVLVKPPVGVSTAAAYAALDAVPDRTPGQATDVWRQGGKTLANDFEPVILPSSPEIAAAYDALGWTPATGESFMPRLCGSGSALFRRMETLQEAARLAEHVQKLNVGKVWVTETTGAAI